MPDFIAIGDIHGCRTMLDLLLAKLPDDGTLIFLGDYIDRGPDAKGVLDRLLRLREERPCVFLRGNHEAMAIAALRGDTRSAELWLYNGGIETIHSYAGEDIPDDHWAFLTATLPYYVTDDFIFVHGGLPPGSQPDESREEELWWIREPFLSSDCDWGRLVIHGHTPQPGAKPEIRPNRINLDTAAVFGGKLTAVLLPERKFVAVKFGAKPRRTRAKS
ncbi:MAG TPA: metallophosphoesterase family protein [Armatimonadota bacterium]|nr:metallophosphoesterase family protein [Armatimonadota bacterium]HOS44168.1 metallophosphoesterase family protein [Armatimonadota bacterium]